MEVTKEQEIVMLEKKIDKLRMDLKLAITFGYYYDNSSTIEMLEDEIYCLQSDLETLEQELTDGIYT